MLSGHRKGRRIHSPYVFSFVSEAIFNSDRLNVPETLKSVHRLALKNKAKLEISDHGAGSQVSTSAERTVGSMARWSSVNRRIGRLLYRISHWYKPSIIVELGTGLGISTAYLAKGYPEAEVFTIEGCAEKANFAAGFIRAQGISNFEVLHGQFDAVLPGIIQGKLPLAGKERVLVFMDGNHRYEPTMRYLNQFLKWKVKELVILLDDIHWSGEMEQAWEEIRSIGEVRITMDLFFMGVVIVREDMSKEDIRLRW